MSATTLNSPATVATAAPVKGNLASLADGYFDHLRGLSPEAATGLKMFSVAVRYEDAETGGGIIRLANKYRSGSFDVDFPSGGLAEAFFDGLARGASAFCGFNARQPDAAPTVEVVADDYEVQVRVNGREEIGYVVGARAEADSWAKGVAFALGVEPTGLAT